ncbi:hypothetical protein LXL04_034312 [Taraxacum kok-saghyz]
MEENQDYSIRDHKLCGYLCVVLSISNNNTQNQSVDNSITKIPIVNTSCDIFRDGTDVGFVSPDGFVLSLINSSSINSSPTDGEGTETPHKSKSECGGGSMGVSRKKLSKIGLVHGSVSVVHQLQALVNKKCMNITSRVVRIARNEESGEVRVVVLVDVYLPISLWSGWQFPRSRSTAAALFRHLSCDWKTRETILDYKKPDPTINTQIWNISDCHVLGCTHHCNSPDTSRNKLFDLHEIFKTLPSISTKGDFVISKLNPADPTSPSGFHLLPDDVLVNILTALTPLDLLKVSSTCHHLRSLAQTIMPSMKLKLFPHQQSAVDWMLKRERDPQVFKNPLYLKLETKDGFFFNINTVTGDLVTGPVPMVKDFRGGMFCDEPGLGKTITALSLILKTLGTLADPPDGVDVVWCKQDGDKKCGYYEVAGGGDGGGRSTRRGLTGLTVSENVTPETPKFVKSSTRSWTKVKRNLFSDHDGPSYPCSDKKRKLGDGNMKKRLKNEMWVQCDSCRKWRKLFDSNITDSATAWFCSMNDDPYYKACNVPEESWDNGQSVTYLPGFYTKGTANGQEENVSFFASVLKEHYQLINFETKKALIWLTKLTDNHLLKMETTGLVHPLTGTRVLTTGEPRGFHKIFQAFGLVKRVDQGTMRWHYPRNLDNLSFDLTALKFALNKPLDSVRFYLSRATLIVVPANLVDHWRTQIEKHVKPGQLRVYIWADHKKPSVHNIAWDYDIVITTFSRLSAEWSPKKRSVLTAVHWVRVMFDEGHTLGSTLNLTNKLQLSVSLTASSRWLLTGTPTPNTPNSQLSSLQPMLKFLREEAYGQDQISWESGILRPFEAKMEEGRNRLLEVLGRCMISARKKDLRMIPACIKKAVFLNFNEEHAKSYNELVVTVRRNILMADWNDPSHVESLLNPKQWKFRGNLIRNVRLSCCVAGHIKVTDAGQDIQETMDILVENGLDPDSEEYGFIRYNILYGGNCMRRGSDFLFPLILILFLLFLMESENSSDVNNNSEKQGHVSGTVNPFSGSDLSSLHITGHKLNGQNYLQWAQSVKIVICGRGKLGYLTGDLPAPPATDPAHNTWQAENSLVLAWLVNSMDPKISRRYLWFQTAKEVWDAARRMYSDLGNASQIFELRAKLKEIKQGSTSVTQYFSTLQDLWQELDLFLDEKLTCAECNVKVQKQIERERVFDFLAGLNRNLDEVRGRVVARDPFPSTEDAFAEVRREEVRRKVMLTDEPPLPLTSTIPDVSALATNRSSDRLRGNRPWCDHCKRPGHTREKCWVLHGKPTNRQSSTPHGRANHVETDVAQSFPFNQAQIDQLYKLLNQSTNLSEQSPSCSIAQSTIAQSGIVPLAFFLSNQALDLWIIDSGASHHMTSNLSLFRDYTPCHSHATVCTANGSHVPIAGSGTITLSSDITLQSVLHVPSFKCGLISVGKLTCQNNCFAKFSPVSCVFQDQTSGKMIGSARFHNDLYYLRNVPPLVNQQSPVSSISSLSSSISQQIMLWHQRMGHPSFSYLKRLFPNLFSNKEVVDFDCEICQFAKHTRVSYAPVSHVPSTPFFLIHSDIWGPSRITTSYGKKWFVTFIDDHSRTTWVYLLQDKSEVGQIFQSFHKMIRTQFQTDIRILRTDNGKEYFNSILGNFLIENGITHQSSCVNTPQQNGVSERKNRHLLEVARALMFTMHVPKYLWGDAVLTATYLINRLPSRTLQFQTPLNVLQNSTPYLSGGNSLPLKTFGCQAFVHIHGHNRSKLEPRAIKTVFVGYSSTQKGYRCFCPTTKKTYISCDVTFFESKPFFPTSLQGETREEASYSWDLSESYTPNIVHDIFVPSVTQQASQPSNPDVTSDSKATESSNSTPLTQTNELSPPHQTQTPTPDPPNQANSFEHSRFQQVYSRRKQTQEIEVDVNPSSCHESDPVLDPSSQKRSGESLPSPHFFPDLDLPIAVRKGVRSCTKHPISKFISYSKLSPTYHAFSSSLSSISIPRTIEEAMTNPEWKKAVLEEMSALKQNQTWSIVDLPHGKQTVGCKWVFNVKYRADGAIERFKARLVAKGFTQTYGIDYTETFAPVAKLNTVRILLSLAANLDWSIHQLDIKNAFLNGKLEEEVYMCQPPGFEEQSGSNPVCRLNKSLYGLKQSPRAWFERFSGVIKKSGFTQGQADHTMFFKHSKLGKITILIVYVDDIIVTGDDEQEIKEVKNIMSKEFQVKDLGAPKYFLGMEFARSSKGISVSQRKYTLDLLKETGMLGCKPSKTPIELGNKKGLCEGKPVDLGSYQRLVGKLIYLSHTRPDIAFAVSLVSQYMHAPLQGHLNAVYRILRYLKNTPGKGLFFGKKDDKRVAAFTDADWGGSDDSRSTSGYCTLVWGNLVTWRSKKQTVVSRSSAEAEYRAIAHGVCELMWIRRVLTELKIPYEEPMVLYCDNTSAISISKNPVHHDRTKHVEIDRNFIKEKLDEKIIRIECEEWCRLPVITPCRHLLCLDCVALNSEKCTFPGCDNLYEMQSPETLARPENPNPKWPVPKDLIELQPSYKQDDWNPDWQSTSSSKVSYLVKRLKDLQEANKITGSCINEGHDRKDVNALLFPFGKTMASARFTNGSVEKVLIFSQFLEHIHVIEQQLTIAGIKFVGMYSPMHSVNKVKSLATFQHDEECMALLMDGSAALGLDLSFVTHVFLMEPIWDKSMEEQVISRAHRMGATRPIHVETLAMHGTIEEQMLNFLQDTDECRKVLKEEHVNEGPRARRTLHDFAESNYLAQLSFVRKTPKN